MIIYLPQFQIKTEFQIQCYIFICSKNILVLICAVFVFITWPEVLQLTNVKRNEWNHMSLLRGKMNFPMSARPSF